MSLIFRLHIALYLMKHNMLTGQMVRKIAVQSNAGDIELTLVPQGSFAEMVRAGGADLGSVITPPRVGTIV